MLDASAEGQEKLPFIKHLFDCSILYQREHFSPQFQLVITLCFETQWLMNLVILAWLVKLHIVYYLYSYKCPLCCFNLPKILASITFSSSSFQKEYFTIFLRKIKGLSLTQIKGWVHLMLHSGFSSPESKTEQGGWRTGTRMIPQVMSIFVLYCPSIQTRWPNSLFCLPSDLMFVFVFYFSN